MSRDLEYPGSYMHGGPPSSIAAEHSVLGAVLYENATLDSVEGMLTAESFFEPTHGRIFQAALDLVAAGRRADPVSVGGRLVHDKALIELGGVEYLALMVDRAEAGAAAVEAARVVQETAQRRTIIRLANDYAQRAARSLETKPLDLVRELETDLLALQSSDQATQLVSAESAVARVLAELEDPGLAAGVNVGIAPLNAATGGLMGGELWLICGRPGMGKSALANCIGLNVARHGRHPSGDRLGVIEINLEMSVSQMTRRHVTDLAFEYAAKVAPAYKAVRGRNLSDAQRAVFYAAAQEIRALPTLKMLKASGLTITKLRSIIRRQQVEWARQGIRLGLVTVDHGGLMRGEGQARRYEAQTDIAIGSKDLAGDLDIPLAVLVQLSREVETRDDKRPHLSDLRDSGAWEENADGVIATYRPAYYANREPEPKGADAREIWLANKESLDLEALLLKNREGSTQKITLWAEIGHNAIRAAAPDNLYGTPSRSFDFIPAPPDLYRGPELNDASAFA